MRSAAWLLLAACHSGAAMTVRDAPSADGTPPDAAAPRHLVAYVSGYAPNIAVFDFDAGTGTLASVGQVAASAASPSFLAMTRTRLYAVSEAGDEIGAYAIDQTTGRPTLLDQVASGGSGPAYVGLDHTGRFVLAANYGDGAVAVLPVRADGGIDGAIANPIAGANAHMIVSDPGNRFVFVPCKGADYIAQYRFDATTGALAPNDPPTVATAAGAGPRHLAFAPGGAFAYVINETNSTLTAFAYAAATGRLTALQTVSSRAPGASGSNTGAEVVVDPTGRFVYVSNRGDDTVAVFSIGGDGRVAQVGHVATGKTPRSFALDPTGAWMLVANQGAGSVSTYALDHATGMPTAVGAPLAVTMPSFVGFVALP